MVFNVGQATVSRDISYLEPVVRECIPLPTKMYAAANRVQSIEDLAAMIPGLAVFVHISEQPICRPQDDETQKKHYSGKAKRHTMKTQYATTYDCTILQTSTAIEEAGMTLPSSRSASPHFQKIFPPSRGWRPTNSSKGASSI